MSRCGAVSGNCRWRMLALHALMWLFLMLALMACGGGSQSPAELTPTTGYAVIQPLAETYAALGGKPVLGEPISGGCLTVDGQLVQYFKRARIAVGPESEGGGNATIYPLGEWALAGVTDPRPASIPTGGEQRVFAGTMHIVRDEFLTFYETHEGERLLSDPISPELNEGELRVQYFRNGRLEWHPDASDGQRVRLGALGEAHLAQGARELRCEFRARPLDVTTASDVLINASVSAPILFGNGDQRVYVDIATPAGVPVVGAVVELTVFHDDGSSTTRIGRTDEAGRVATDLALPLLKPGQEVKVNVAALKAGDEILGQRALSFRTWW